jgi:hypothetical protein
MTPAELAQSAECGDPGLEQVRSEIFDPGKLPD